MHISERLTEEAAEELDGEIWDPDADSSDEAEGRFLGMGPSGHWDLRRASDAASR